MPNHESIFKKTSELFPVSNPTDVRASLATNKAAPAWNKRNVNELKGMVWHQSLGRGSVEAVAKYHTGKNSHLRKGGVRSISYTFAIRRNGEILLCNDLEIRVWSQGFRPPPVRIYHSQAVSHLLSV